MVAKEATATPHKYVLLVFTERLANGWPNSVEHSHSLPYDGMKLVTMLWWDRMPKQDVKLYTVHA